jgi:hypothetical protein
MEERCSYLSSIFIPPPDFSSPSSCSYLSSIFIPSPDFSSPSSCSYLSFKYGGEIGTGGRGMRKQGKE